MLIIIVLVLPTLIVALPISSCGLCPAQSSCGVDANGRASCICNAGFGGQHCDILLCHSSLCLGPRSICENTMGGPVCHCEKGREGTNCELIEGESHPWSRCANATFCEASFQNGKCDELCNTPFCLYDGNDCDDEESVDDHENTVIPEGTVANQEPALPSVGHPSFTLTIALIGISCLLLIIILIIFVRTRCVVKKEATVVRRPPSLPIPPTPRPTHTPQPQPTHYSDGSVGYATIPSISQSVAQYSDYYHYASGYATLPAISHSQAPSSIGSDYTRFL